jgi:hypothetical protein
LIAALLILGALVTATAVAFGCDPSIADYAGGVEVIRVMYRLQGALIGLTVLFSLSLVGLVVTSRRRGYWLIGLFPVMALFVWRFGLSPQQPGLVDDAPTFVQALRTDWMDGNGAVLGISAGDQTFAIPLAAMQLAPAVVHTERERRLIVTWSAGAQLATACWCDRSIRGRDLRIVASPRGVLLLFNSRLGEFFDALTFAQSNSEPFTGFASRVAVEVTTWESWKARHLDTQLLDPRQPIEVVPPPAQRSVETVIVVGSQPPIVVPTAELLDQPANVSNGKTSALLFRTTDGSLRAFERKVEQDLFLKFEPHADKSLPNVKLIDTDTKSLWTLAGECVEGELKGRRLPRLVALDAVPAAAARYWIKE